MGRKSPLPPSTLERLPKHVARLNSAIARLRLGGHAVAMAVRNGQVVVTVDGDAPKIAAAKATVAAAVEPPEEKPRKVAKPPKRARPARHSKANGAADGDKFI